MRGLDRLALAPSSEAREDASRGDPQPAETCRRPLAPAPPCSCSRADPPPTRQRGSDRPVLALSSTAPPPKSCSVSLPSLARMRTALSVPRCGLGAHTRLATTAVCCRLRARMEGIPRYPRRACAARVTVLVCVCVYLSVTALAATAFVSTCNQRHLWHYYRLFLDFNSWIFEKAFRSKVMA